MEDITKLLKQGSGKTLMTIFPHPDDESMPVGGLLIAAQKWGWKTIVVSLTPGGAGRIHIKGQGKSLAEIRGEELKEATRIMKVDIVEVGDFDDGKLKTELGWKKWVDLMMDKYQPEVVVTYDPSGFYGHPDHIAVSKYLYGKYMQMGSEKGWQLWFMAVPELFKGRWKITGMEKVLGQMVEPTYRLNLGWNWLLKWQAVRAHKSQKLGKGLPIPLWMFMAINHFEWYHVVTDQSKCIYKYSDYKI